MALEHIGLQAILADEQFQQGLKRYADGVSRMETVTDRGASTMTKAWAVGGAAVTVGAAAVVAGAAAVAVITKQGLDALNDWGNQLDALGDTLGTTGEQSSTWAIAMKQVGLNVEEGASGLNVFIRNLDNGGDAMKKALQTLGVNMHDANGNLRTFDDLMPDIMRAFSRMPDGVKKSALAMDLFGRSGTKFLDFLSQGEGGLEKATRLGKLYGLTVSSEMVQATQDSQNALQVTNLGIQGFWVQIGAKVLPVATRFVNVLNDRLLPPLIAFAQKIAPKLGEVLGKGLILFEDLFDLLEGKGNMIPQLAGDIGAFAGALGLNEEAVASFVSIALTNLNALKDWLVGFLPLLQKGDWGGVWERFASGVSNAWKNIQPILAEWAGKIWNWLEDAAAAAPARIGEFINGVATFLAEHGPGAWAQLSAWGTQFWNWLTETAVPMLATKAGELLAGIGDWIVKNGPGTWAALAAWGAQFWDWLTNPTTGAIINAGMELQKIATAIGTWASTAWDSTIQPALADWGTRFWNWLVDPENGAIAQLANKLNEVSDAILRWSDDPATQQAMYDAGYNLADQLIDAIGGFFDGKEGDARAVEVLEKLGTALFRAQLAMDRAKYDIGGKIAQGIYDRMAEWFAENSPKISASIYEWLNKAADDLLANLNALAEKIGMGIANALAEFWKTHPLTLPSLQLPQFSPTSYIPAGANGGTAQQVAFQQMQAVPLSLVVKIGENEIQNAVVEWVSNEVQSQFSEATAALATA